MKIIAGILDYLKKKLEYAVAFITLAVFVSLSLTESGVKIEYGMYDTLLAIKPEVSERKDVLLVNIDDEAIEQIGAWPWTRDIIGNALVRLRESGGRYAVFDIEYLSPGQTGVNRNYVKTEFPAEYKSVHQEILQYLSDFSGAVSSGSIPVEYAVDVGTEMSGYIDERLNGLAESISSNIFQDNDEYFARSLKFFGKSYLTINAERINTNDDTEILNKWAYENRLWTNVLDPGGKIARETAHTYRDSDFERGIAPAILPLLQASSGAGFPNVIIDEDGVRRRIELLAEHEGAYVAQLVFSPVLDILKPELLERRGRTLILRNALDPKNPESGQRSDISIPLDDHGRFLINWLKRAFTSVSDPTDQSFRHISVYALKLADDLEEQLIDNLSRITEYGIRDSSGFLPYHEAAVWLLSSYADLNAWKESLMDESRNDYSGYFAARDEFFAMYEEYLTGGYDEEIKTVFDRIKEATGDSRYDELSANIMGNFQVYRDQFALYREHISRLEKECEGSFCIIGYSGVGTSDLGVNPFQKSYANVGTHANIYNTIMTQEFIYPFPSWFSWILSFVLALVSGIAYRRIKGLKGRILFGIASIVVVYLSFAAAFALFRVYIHVFAPLMTVVVTFLLVSILKFIFSEQEKSFLRKAFTMYLSSDVVNQIVEDPSLLKLGGQEKQITALFTDIKSFSTLSEKVTPEHLVEILNKYLTVMSDIVLEQKGTIDKYIGDAIVSFFGAPIDLPDHASRACLAAVRMKQAEEKLNEEMMAANETPMPIYTRIGVNTGAMVVGNMGTDNKMNYTIMGNDVNLAARLEGVNKAYGTWILVSESTWNQTNGMFLGRKLDRVRVVGINTPVQLYNIMAVRSEASGRMVALAEKFNSAIDAYREKRFGDSIILFSKCLEIEPDDAASSIFLEKVHKLVKEGVPPDWSDVVNMTSK